MFDLIHPVARKRNFKARNRRRITAILFLSTIVFGGPFLLWQLSASITSQSLVAAEQKSSQPPNSDEAPDESSDEEMTPEDANSDEQMDENETESEVTPGEENADDEPAMPVESDEDERPIPIQSEDEVPTEDAMVEDQQPSENDSVLEKTDDSNASDQPSADEMTDEEKPEEDTSEDKMTDEDPAEEEPMDEAPDTQTSDNHDEEELIKATAAKRQAEAAEEAALAKKRAEEMERANAKKAEDEKALAERMAAEKAAKENLARERVGSEKAAVDNDRTERMAAERMMIERIEKELDNELNRAKEKLRQSIEQSIPGPSSDTKPRSLLHQNLEGGPIREELNSVRRDFESRIDRLERMQTQKYSAWKRSIGGEYYVCTYRCTPVGSDVESFNCAYFYPSDPMYVYFFNPKDCVYWGRFLIGEPENSEWEWLPVSERIVACAGSPPRGQFSMRGAMPMVYQTLDSRQRMLWPSLFGLPGIASEIATRSKMTTSPSIFAPPPPAEKALPIQPKSVPQY